MPWASGTLGDGSLPRRACLPWGRVSTWAMGQGSPRNGVWAACEPSPPWAALTGEPESGTPTLPGRPAPGSPGSCRRLVPPERGSSGDNAAHKTRSLGCTLQESTPEATHSFPSARWEDPTTRGKAGDRLGPDAVRRPQPRPRRLPLSHAPQGASEDSGPYPPQSRSEFQFPSLRHTDAAAGTRGQVMGWLAGDFGCRRGISLPGEPMGVRTGTCGEAGTLGVAGRLGPRPSPDGFLPGRVWGLGLPSQKPGALAAFAAVSGDDRGSGSERLQAASVPPGGAPLPVPYSCAAFLGTELGPGKSCPGHLFDIPVRLGEGL